MSRFRIIVASGVVALAALAGPALADIKIGVVNADKLIQESPQYKQAQQRLTTEFAPRQKELQALQTSLKAKEDALQKNGATMTADQRSQAQQELRDGSRDYSAKLSALQDDVNARQNEETSKLQRAVIEEVQAYAQAQKFDLVLANGVIYANGSMDITNAVLAGMQSRAAPRSGTAPAKASGSK